MKPTVGRVVHYVSYGTPGGEYASECRAAIITEVTPAGTLAVDLSDAREDTVGLCVLNPTGLFFNRAVPHHGGDVGHDHTGERMENMSYRGGTWHWPERAEETS